MSRTVFVGILFVGLGASFSVGLRFLLHVYSRLIVPWPPESQALWLAAIQPALSALVQVLPAFVVGWLARHSGFLLGALVGATCALYLAPFNFAWHNMSSLQFDIFFAVQLFASVFSGAVLSSVAGAAGELARSRLPSNYSFQRTLIRYAASRR